MRHEDEILLEKLNESLRESGVEIPITQFEHGRLLEDYEDISFLGAGGFGTVVKAKCKVDKNYYAIKLVPIKDKTSLRYLENEISCLLRLYHENIARYYSSWAENAIFYENEINKDEEDFASNETIFTNSDSVSTNSKSVINSTESFFETENASNSIITSSSEITNENCSLSILTSSVESSVKDAMLQIPKIFFIKMEYCGRITLRALIDSKELIENIVIDKDWRFNVDNNLRMNIFIQIIQGLNHIHSNGIIHRDLKPENIFLMKTSDSYKVNSATIKKFINSAFKTKIGDFGISFASKENIALEIDDHKTEQVSKIPTNYGEKGFNLNFSNAKTYVGTSLYMAPELFLKKPYTSKCDIYSIGIIFFEMAYYPFTTAYEKSIVIEQLVANNALSDMTLDFPIDFGEYLSAAEDAFTKDTITLMLQGNPEKRTSLEQLTKKVIPLENLPLRTTYMYSVKASRFWQIGDERLSKPLFDISGINGISDDILISQTENTIRNFLRNSGLLEISYDFVVPREKHEHTDKPNHDWFGYLLLLQNKASQDIASFSNSNFRCFAFGKVKTHSFYYKYKRQAVVDFTAPLKYEYAINMNAEVFSLIVNFVKLSKAKLLKGISHTIRIGNVNIIAAICNFYDYSLDELVKLLNKSLPKTYKDIMKTRRYYFSKAEWIKKDEIESLMKLFEPTDSLTLLREKLAYLHENENASKRLTGFFNSMNNIVNRLKIFCDNNDIPIIYDPGFTYRPHFFTAYYAVQVELPLLQRTEIILGGGRYDYEFEQKRKVDNPTDTSDLCAFGINIAVENICTYIKTDTSYSGSNRVLIFSNNYAIEALKLKKMLLDKNILVSTTYDEEFSMINLMEQCRAQCFAVLLKITGENKVCFYEIESKTTEGKEFTFEEAVSQITKNTDINV